MKIWVCLWIKLNTNTMVLIIKKILGLMIDVTKMFNDAEHVTKFRFHIRFYHYIYYRDFNIPIFAEILCMLPATKAVHCLHLK
jgi:hypothetical protein